MARPNLSAERRRQLIPELAQTFAEHGYRRTTTAELARRCKVRENILYRLWKDKREMFIASIDYVYDLSSAIWGELLSGDSAGSSGARRLLQYESRHHGEFGFYRIVFAGLSEADDPEIRDALHRMYTHFQNFILKQIEQYRLSSGSGSKPEAALRAWALIGLGTVADIGKEFGLFPEEKRVLLLNQVGKLLLEGKLK